MPIQHNPVTPDMIRSALEEVAEEVHQQIIEAIERVDWPWPRETRRKNKTIAKLERDIVDLGTLRGSQTWETEYSASGRTTIVFKNTAPHATLVHDGGFNGSFEELPARPFMQNTLIKLDLGQMIADRLSVRLGIDSLGRSFAKDTRGRFTLVLRQWDIYKSIVPAVQNIMASRAFIIHDTPSIRNYAEINGEIFYSQARILLTATDLRPYS